MCGFSSGPGFDAHGHAATDLRNSRGKLRTFVALPSQDAEENNMPPREPEPTRQPGPARLPRQPEPPRR
jgi:hypothetical protein